MIRRTLLDRLSAGAFVASGLLLAFLVVLAPHPFTGLASQTPTRCGGDQLPVVPYVNASLALTPDSGVELSGFTAIVTGIGANTTQADQPADLIWDQGLGSPQVLVFGSYADGANSISMNGQVPAGAPAGQHPVRVCWLYPPDQKWYYIDGSFIVLQPTPTPTPTFTPTPTPTATPTGTTTSTPTATPVPSLAPIVTPLLPEMILGDGNCDDKVDGLDALSDLRLIAVLGPFTDCLSAADVNDDQKLDLTDVIVSLRYTAHLPTPPGLGLLLARQPPRYSILDLSPDGGHANGINSWGEVVGDFLPFPDTHAFFWDPGASPKLRDLGTLYGRDSVANGINYYHQVAGYTAGPDAPWNPHGFVWDAATGMHDLAAGTGNTDSQLYAINSAGEAAGVYAAPYYRAATWTEAGGFQYISGAADGTWATALNDTGTVVGFKLPSTVGAVPYRALGWNDDGSQFEMPNTLGAACPVGAGYTLTSKAQGVNLTRQVVGVACIAGNQQAFIWNSSKGMRNLGSLGWCLGNECGEANAVNLWDQAVGSARASDSRTHAVVWDKGKAEDLNSLIAKGTEWAYLQEATAITDRGLIVGNGYLTGTGEDYGDARPFLLVPVVLDTFTALPATVTGGLFATGKITLSGEAPIPMDISITSSNSAASPPATVTIPRGGKEITFPIATTEGAGPVTVHLTASFGGWSLTAPVTVNP